MSDHPNDHDVLREAEAIAEIEQRIADGRDLLRQVADTWPDEMLLPVLRAVRGVLEANCPGEGCPGHHVGQHRERATD